MSAYEGYKLGPPYCPGDMYLFPILDGEFPENAKPHEPENECLIIGHSESGHHHVMDYDVIDRPNVEMFDADDPLEGWLRVNRPTSLRHAKVGKDAHETIVIKTGLYLIRRQREDSPEGWRRAID